MGVLVVLVTTWYGFNESKTSTTRLTSGLSGLSKLMLQLVSLLCRKRRCIAKEILGDKHGLQERNTFLARLTMYRLRRGPNVPSHAIT